VTATTTLPATAFHADFCDDPGHPDSHCVQAAMPIDDVYGRRTSIAAFQNCADESVGVYVGSQILMSDGARRMAAALINAADAADEALAELNRAGR
jgi:hypothetical protein